MARGRTLSVALVFCLWLALIAASLAQVNFSPSWGKRSPPSPPLGQSPDSACKASMESLMYLYKLVQSEAQKIVDCEKFSN